MKGIVGNIVNIVGTALFLGLILRYNKEAVAFVQQSGSTSVSLYKAVSLQDIGSSQRNG